jgi:Zn finger protein HypA/HybF involved in hydrogenase expression
MGYMSRLPNSNDLPHEHENRWLSTNEFLDETALLIQGRALRCRACRRATDKKHLDKNQKCPDCGRSGL